MFLVDKATLSSPFRSITKKSSSAQAAKNYLLAAKSFDEKVILHLKTLDLVPNSSNISLSWLSKSVSFLSSIHFEAENQISNLKSDVDEFQALYMDYSLKVLDLCNLITSAVQGLTDRRLLLNYSLRLLNFTADQIPAIEKLYKAKDAIHRSVDKTHESESEKSQRGQRAKDLIGEVEVLISKLLIPRGKASGEIDLIRRTFYAIGVLTVFVGKVLVSVLFGEFDLVKLRVPVEFIWSDSVNDLQNRIFDLIEPKQNSLLEVDDLANQVALVCALIQAVEVNGEGNGEDKFRLVDGVKSLATAAKKYSDGIDALTNGVNGMFRTVLKTRNGRLDV